MSERQTGRLVECDCCAVKVRETGSDRRSNSWCGADVRAWGVFGWLLCGACLARCSELDDVAFAALAKEKGFV